MAFHDHVLHAGRGDENVADLRRLVHLHDAEAFERRFQCGGRLHFGHDHVRAESLGAERNALAAVAEAGHDDVLPGKEHARRAQDAVQRRLPRPVDVVEVPLGFRIVHGDHRILQRAVGRHRAKPVDTGGGFLRPADDEFLGELRMISCGW